jgi:hypothetical protein
MLASFLEHGAPGALDADSFSAIFDNSYYEGMVQRREHLRLIQEELAAAAGRPLAFRVRAGALPISRRSSGARPPEEESPREGPRDLLTENPGLRRIVQELGGQVLPGGDPAGG